MKTKRIPTINLENLSCAIRCCISVAPDLTDGHNEDTESGSDPVETNLHRFEEFSSPRKLFRAAKKENPDIQLRDVNEWLETQKSYTLHCRFRAKFRRRKVVTRGVHYQYQADLVDYSKLRRDNSG